MGRRLSEAQALEVAKRLDPRGTTHLRFSADGVVVADSITAPEWRRYQMDVWDCWRRDGVVQVVRLST